MAMLVYWRVMVHDETLLSDTVAMATRNPGSTHQLRER